MKRTLLIILLTTNLITKGQQPISVSPGGVPGVELWFKTVPLTQDPLGFYHWQDFSGNDAKVHHHEGTGAANAKNEFIVPQRDIRTYNFHPALNLSLVPTFSAKEIYLPRTNLSQLSILGVFGTSAEYETDKHLYTLNGRPTEGRIITKGKIVASKESNKEVLNYGSEEGKNLLNTSQLKEPTVEKFREKILRVMSYYKSSQPNYTLWGENTTSVISLGDIFYPQNINNTSTYDITTFNNQKFWGFAPEFILYNRLLTPLERRKIETYLAVKYGFTLDKSYIGSSGNLLWDLEENKKYNNRITGIARDDISTLYQKVSTTTYQEKYYTDYYDTYDLSNINSQSSRYRLLTIGLQNANTLSDSEYAIWGDDDQTLATQESDQILGMNIMNRHWLLKTNITPIPEDKKQLDWEYINATIETLDPSGFKNKITKYAADADPQGYIQTKTPLLAENGYLSWTHQTISAGSSIIVQFGNKDTKDNNYNYGYHINSLGGIHKIVQGIKEGLSLHTIRKGEKIEVEKVNNDIYLRINGIRIPTSTLEIKPEDKNKPYYGLVTIDNSRAQTDLVIENFRHGGFSNTGNKVELSYFDQLASEFSNYKEKSYLVIDRSGTGNFQEGNVEYYPVDEIDQTRSKLIFNNIFWDTDGNGKDLFTFAYKTKNLIAQLDPTHPTCDPHGTENADGTLTINIEQGYKAYEYSLKKEEEIVAEGLTYSDTLQLSGLPAGQYTLRLKERGQVNFFRTKDDPIRYYTAASTRQIPRTGSIEWTIKGPAEIEAGLSSSNTTLIYEAGARIKDYKLTPVVKKVWQQELPIVLSPFDRISIERDRNQAIYKVNGKEIYRATITTLSLYGAVMLGYTGEIYNLRFNGAPADNTWFANYGNLTIEESEDEIIKDIFLASSCTQKPETPEIPEEQTQPDPKLILYQKYPGITNLHGARLNLNTPSEAMLLLFDISGDLLYTKNQREKKQDHEFDIPLLPIGAYIVKIITNDKEYTGRILVIN